jgi:hypothetical protein
MSTLKTRGEIFGPVAVESTKWPPDPGVDGAVTAEVTEGQWLKMSANLKKYATPVTNFKQPLFFAPPTGALKPPLAAAYSNRIDLNDANFYLKTRDFSDHSWSSHSSGLRASRGRVLQVDSGPGVVRTSK